MLESEKSSLFGRVHDLERRVLTQQDEIVCLRSTLADVLRRLNTIEGNIERGAITNSSLSIQGSGRSAPNTPSRNGVPGFNRRMCHFLSFFHICFFFLVMRMHFLLNFLFAFQKFSFIAKFSPFKFIARHELCDRQRLEIAQASCTFGTRFNNARNAFETP